MLLQAGMDRLARVSVACFLTLALLQGAQGADDQYPSRAVQVIIPYPGGSGSDTIGRLVFERVSQLAGQPFVIENRPAAGGIVGTKAITSAAPDGYTIVLSAAGPLVINTALAKNLPYDVEKDFAPISKVASVPNLLVVSSKLPVNSVAEFLEFAKKSKNPLNYSSVGIGSASHLAAAHFAVSAGVNMAHVPYKGMSQLVTDLMSGDVPVSFTVYSNVAGAIQSGQVKVLAVAAEKRLPALPNVPTLSELGIAAIDSSAWFAVLAPRDTPDAIVSSLNRLIVAALSEPAIKARFVEMGAIPDPSSPQALKKMIASEIMKWRKVSDETGIKIE
jgi:tripartite-type tricarboxylate transporter receptor subunit TctC